MLTADHYDMFETGYRNLGTANKLLHDLQLDICRLTVAKKFKFPNPWETYHSNISGDKFPFTPQWVESATLSGLFESAANLDREIERVDASKKKLEAIQSALRRCIDRLSRPHLRSLNILDLPNEILLKIFELVEDFNVDCPFAYRGSNFRARRKDIANTRLVCRHFCNLSSQLLIRLVRVNLTESSIARLEGISRHPTIAKGVRAVRVVFHLHNASFTAFDRFISYQASKVREQVESFLRGELCGIPQQTKSEMISNGMAVASTLERLASADADNDGRCVEDVNRRAWLDAIHRKYLTLVEKQVSMIQSERFSRLVGSAIARMPSARRLDFRDTDNDFLPEWGLMIPGEDIWNALYSLMLQPISGHEAEWYFLELPNYECIVQVIEAVRHAGALLSCIDINLSILGNSRDLVPAADIRREFSSGMQQLKVFSFTCDRIAHYQDVGDVNEFLSACLDTASLQKLSLDMECQPRTASSRIDIGQVMGSRPRPKLTDIFLRHVTVDLSRLVLLLEALPQSMTRIHQRDVRLRSGTWKEALDVLRRKKCRTMEFNSPKGAECDVMPETDYYRIFLDTPYQDCLSETERYLTNRTHSKSIPCKPLKTRETL